MRKRCLGVKDEQTDDIMEKLAMVKKRTKASPAELQARRKKMLEERERQDDVQDNAAQEKFYGENFVRHIRERGEEVNDLEVAERQILSMRLYEGRIASLQRAVAMFVMFHELGKRVQDFWPSWTLGCLGYDMARTHSIMRIATTASPVSGAEVRDRTLQLARQTKVKWALSMIGRLIASKREYIEYLVKTKGTRPKRERITQRVKEAKDVAAPSRPQITAGPVNGVSQDPHNQVLPEEATPADGNALSKGWSSSNAGAGMDTILPGTPDVTHRSEAPPRTEPESVMKTVES